MNFKKTLFLSCAAACTGGLFAQSSGQNYTISPYSNFGLGEVLNANIAEVGYSGQTYTGAYSYSFFNPATLRNLRYTSFDFGINSRYAQIESNSETRSFNGGGLSYMALAFPVLNRKIPQYRDSAGIKKRSGSLPIGWNASVGLFPITSVGYNYAAEDSSPFYSRTLHSGAGGINSLQWSNGFSIGKDISLGYSVAYVFGQLKDRSVFSIPDSTDLSYIDDEKAVTINGLQHQFGAMYQFELDSTYHRFGASYRMYSGIRAAESRLAQVVGFTSTTVTIDTVINDVSNKKPFSIPGGFGLGYTFQWRKKWSIGLDYYKQNWASYSAFFQSGQKLASRSDYGFTFNLNPVDEKLSGAKKMPVPIRLGGRYSSTQNVFTKNGSSTTIVEQSAFIGFGIPLVRRYYDNQVLRSMINFRFDYITRGTTANGLAKEQYFVANVSFSLGDIWFQRRKFE